MSTSAPRRTILSSVVVLAATLLGRPAGLAPPVLAAQLCAEPERVSRDEMRQAMRLHGDYSLTSTTTSMRFGAEALFEIVRRRQRERPGKTLLLVDHADWFAAHLETAGVSYGEMSESARAGFEHRQDALIDFGHQVLDSVLEGPAPRMGLDVTIFLPDSGGPSQFSYRDTLSVPKVDVYNSRVIRFKLLEYEDMLVFDRVSGISVRPIGFLSGIFAVLGKPDLKQTRVAVSEDQWQVVRGQVKIFPGIPKTGTAWIEPDGRGHEDPPAGREDLRRMRERMRGSLELRYGPPSCQARMKLRRDGRSAADCPRVMGGVGICPGS